MKNKGFTLIELLVVIAIISLLVSILLPSLQKAKNLAKTVGCLSNCRSIGAAFGMYLADENGSYPGWSGPTEGKALSWNVAFVQKGYVGDYNFFDCPADMVTNVADLPSVTQDWSEKVWFGEYGYNFMSLGMKNSWFYRLSQHDYATAKDSDIANPAETICVVDSAFSLTGARYGQRGYYAVCPWYDPGSWVGMPAARHNFSVNIQWADGHCETSSPMLDLPESPTAYDAGSNPYFYAPFDNGDRGANLSDNYWSRY